MESVAHSRQPNKVSVTLSSKINNGGFSYDDVYGGPPPKFGVSSLSPRFEDYGEIFGSFKKARASSIPLLDLPVVDETDAFFDPRSSAFNYGEVFGALDFAVSFEDLVDQPNALDCVSSEEAWTPAETDSFSGESDHSVNNQSTSNGDLFQSVYGSTEFGISYHKVNGTGNEHMLKEETHMNQLHAVPGFPLVYDESTQLSRNDPSFQVTDDIDLDMDFSADKVLGNHQRKTVPHLPNFTSGEQAFGSDLNLHNECSRNGSHSSEMFITVSDISLKSMPSPVPPLSRPPPVLDAKEGDTCVSNNGWVASKEIPSDNSPPFFDVEVDMTSSAAPSAAAMQETMHRAEAKLRCAKELKERKKGVYESHVKSSYDVENNDAKMNKNMTRLSSSNDEAVQETCDRRHSKTKISVTDERQKSRKACTETLDTLEGKIILNMLEVKHTKESRSPQDSDRGTGVGTWKEESELFELVGTEVYGKVTQPTKHSKILVQDIRTHERGQKESEVSNMQEYKKVKSIEKNYYVEEYEKNSKAVIEACEHDKNIRKSKASNDECRQRNQEENEKNMREVYQHGKMEKIVTEADLRSLEDPSEMQDKEHKQVGNEKSKERQTPSEVQLGVRLKENEKKLQEVQKQQQSVKNQNQFEQMKESGRRPIEAFSLGQAEDEENLKDSVELEDIDERSNKAFKQDKADEKDACRREEIEKTTKACSKNEESHKGLKHAPGWEENEKRLEEFEVEVNEIRMKEAFKRQRENDRREKWAYERDKNQKKLEEVRDGYRGGNRLKEAGDNEGIQEVLNQASEKEWSGGILGEIQTKKEIESSLNQIFDREGSVKVSNEDIYPEQSENMVKDVGRKENDRGLHKDLDQIEGNKEEKIMKFAKATNKTWEIESEGNLLAAWLASTFAENIGKLEVSQESVADQKIGKTVTECKVGEKKLEEIGVENQLANENIGAPEMITRDAERSAGKVDESVKKADDRRSIEAAEPATVQESVNVQKTTQWLHVGQSTERKENNVSEIPATVVKDPEGMRREIESEKDRLRQIEEEDREREREKDGIAVDKAMLEAEREREREKDRMAVDRATFEARDRTYAEACERAQRPAFERANVEARQRALAEARERLEKACAEARSYTDKATTEARLKAERAAVERATAEAQERAMEKLKVERAVFESRERLERSVSDKFGVCSSDMLDPQFQNFSSSTGTKYPYSVYGASSFSGRSEREGESAQRCRARLERHRRTAERAAKALAEKNMRDLLAQKEQAERNRLAETLDAEVRRWSSGKEGNLRALLSTLQYILGPDCGWQSIPLTEVITSAAVKKAYRKATLCVHPDKLQQRGASIQHKYICEKVFDLLKDAWNKFNSEER